MPQVTGIVKIKVDGALLRSKEGASIEFGGKERTPQMGHSFYGMSEKLVPAIISFTLAHVGGDDLIGLQNKLDTQLLYITDTGDTYKVQNAATTKPLKLTGGEGDVEVEMAGDIAEKL